MIDMARMGKNDRRMHCNIRFCIIKWITASRKRQNYDIKGDYAAIKKMTALFMVLTLLLPGLAMSEGNPSPEEILAGMTTEQKVAQLLMPAFYYIQAE